MRIIKFAIAQAAWQPIQTTDEPAISFQISISTPDMKIRLLRPFVLRGCGSVVEWSSVRYKAWGSNPSKKKMTKPFVLRIPVKDQMIGSTFCPKVF